MRCFQIRLRSWWDFQDELLRIPWDPLYKEDPLWWSWATQQREGIDLSLPVPDLSFYSDESDVKGRHRRGTPSVRSLDSKPMGTLHQPQGDDGSPGWPLRVQLSSQEAGRSLSFATLSRQSLTSGDREARGLRTCSSKRGRFSYW